MNNTSADSYLKDGCGRCEHYKTAQCKVLRWTAALVALRKLLLASELVEEMKWGSPCYSLGGKNVVMLTSFNDFCALSFFKGSLLVDEGGLLEAPGPNTRLARLLKFTSAKQVRASRDVVRSSRGGPGETSAGSESTSSSGETCGTSCGSGDPEVVWVAEPEHDLWGGGCVDVLGDGEGGAIASFMTNPESPLWGGLVLAVGDGGAVEAEDQLEERRLTGLQRAGAGAFSWVDSYANAGESSTGLDDLQGDWLAKDLLSLDDLAPVTGGTAYTAVINAFFPECRIRLRVGGTLDSPSLPCGDIDDRWRLRPTVDGGVVAGLVGQSALVRLASNADMPAYLEWRDQRTMLDFAVDGEDRVWTVGIIRNPNEAGPAFGSFVARHGPDLGEDPQWEVLEEGDASYAWTTIAMWQGEPILVGRDADAVPRVVALDSAGDERWALELDLPPSVLLRRADVDEQGRLFLCGDRLIDDGPLAVSSPVVVRIDL